MEVQIMSSVVENRLLDIRKNYSPTYFKASDGFRLHYLKMGQSKDAIVILPGMGEPALKYWELGKDLVEKNFSVFVLDHLGHGFSDHQLGSKKRELVHIDVFQRYVDHALDFYKEINKKHAPCSLQLLCHSMGGLIGSGLAMVTPIQRIALSSPMFAINTKGVPVRLSKFLAKVSPQSWAAPLQKPYNQKNIALNQVTHCEVRAEFYYELLNQYPELHREKVTNSWLQTALDQCSDFMKNYSSLKSKNILVALSGKDSFVYPEKTKSVAKSLGLDNLIEFPQARHEILMEKDEYRSVAMNSIYEFFYEGMCS